MPARRFTVWQSVTMSPQPDPYLGRKYEEGAFDDDAQAADLIQEYEARIAALERLVGKQALELEFLKGARKAHRGREAGLHPSSPAPRHLRRRRMPADGDRALDLLRPPEKAADDTAIVEAMCAICDEFEAYGYRRVGAALRQQGIVVNHKKIRRLMREHDLQPRTRRRFVATTDSDHDGPIFPNLAKDMVSTVRTSSGSATSPMSQSRPASSMSPSSWTPGRAWSSATQSAARSMRA